LFAVETECAAVPDQHEGMSVRRAKSLRRVEHYWLCDECANFITLTFDRERGMITIPLPEFGSRPLLTRTPPHQPPPDAQKPETRAANGVLARARGAL
jgi:hypothetical protein